MGERRCFLFHLFFLKLFFIVYAIIVKYRIFIKISGIVSPSYQKMAVIEKRVCCSQFPEGRAPEATVGSEA